MNSETGNETESEAGLNNPSGDVSMFSETASPEPEGLLSQATLDETNRETNGEVGALVELMEQQIDDQNIEIKELKKQIENLKSLLISQFPHFLNAVLIYT